MKSALHQDTGAAQRQGFVDFPADGLERLNVTLGRADGPVESTERAVLRADVCVVDIAVDLVGDDVTGMQPLAKRVSFHGDADQVIGAKHVERLGISQAHDEISFSASASERELYQASATRNPSLSRARKFPSLARA